MTPREAFARAIQIGCRYEFDLNAKRHMANYPSTEKRINKEFESCMEVLMCYMNGWQKIDENRADCDLEAIKKHPEFPQELREACPTFATMFEDKIREARGLPSE